jgi:hypothetical protein
MVVAIIEFGQRTILCRSAQLLGGRQPILFKSGTV